MKNGKKEDYDPETCAGCGDDVEKPIQSPWGLLYCSTTCKTKHGIELAEDAECERLAEIAGGYQI